MDKIDIVYLWVDSNDRKWREKKRKFLNSHTSICEEANLECRFLNNDELKYSLRSVEKYASWISNIYIVTDEQIPDWLNTNHPKIKVVFQDDILPAAALPCYNSAVIECFIDNIESLSECFLYANDDMFFADYVTKEFFFNKEKYPICRFGKPLTNNKINKNLYLKSVHNAQKIIQEN